jgi:hypothetical protein
VLVTGRTARAFALLPALAVQAAVLGALAHDARADVAQCVKANAHAQALRRDGKLAAARAELLACSNPSCPELVRDDCAQRLDEVERTQPTVLFDARDGDGRDLVAVRVTMDGQPLTDRLEGKVLRVDPGAHTFTFTVEGQPAVTQTFVLKEGERDRRERIVIGQPTAPAPTAVAAPASSTATAPVEASSDGLGSKRILGLGLAGAGVVGIGLGTVFGLMASSAWSSAKSACGGDTRSCTNVASATSYRSTTNTDGTVSTVGFVAGGALLAAGGVLFLLGGRHDGPSTTGISVVPAIGQTQQGFLLRGTF